MQFEFGEFKTTVRVSREIPLFDQIASDLGVDGSSRFLVICDENTSPIADAVCGSLPRCLLKSGESSKTWQGVQSILSAAQEAGIGRDGVFIGIGGGVIGDLSGFAASVYMRGCRLALVATTLLAMVDASLGGKTGFDLFGIKNLAGSFYPAEIVYMPLNCLASLAPAELKSGMGELIKTAVLAGDDFLDGLDQFAFGFPGNFASNLLPDERFCQYISRAAAFKGRIAGEDPKETGKMRMLLNLGHTFGHALEAAAGLGNISHGEAVAWGMVRSAELGFALGLTPRSRAEKIREVISSYGYEIRAPHPLARDTDSFLAAMKNDKKKKSGRLTFIVPDDKDAVSEVCARHIVIESEKEMKTVMGIIKGEITF